MDVLLKGLPHDVPVNVMAYHLDKFLDTDEIGTFKVKELALNSRNKWQVVISFKSSYDAFTAQSILQGFRYKWADGEEYLLQAKVAEQTSSQSRNWHTLANETWGHSSSSSLVSHMSHDDARNCNKMLDMKLELLKKQKLLLQTEREVMEEKRKLERVYRKRQMYDSDDESVTKYRPCKEQRGRPDDGPKRVRTSLDETWSGSKRWSKSRSRSRAVSRSVIREMTPDHSRSRAVLRSIVREISPDRSRSRTVFKSSDVPRSIARKTPLNYMDSPLSSPNSTNAVAIYKPPPVYARHCTRPRSPDSTKLYRRRTSPEFMSYRPRSPKNSDSYHRRRSPEYEPTRCRRQSPDSMREVDRSWDYYQSHGRPRAHCSRSPEYSGSSRRSRNAGHESPDRYRRDKGKRHESKKGRSLKDQSTNTEVIDVTITIQGKSTETIANKTVQSNETVTSNETATNESDESSKQTDTNKNIIKTEYDDITDDDDNKDFDFKLQINKAIRQIMTTLQDLLNVVKGIRQSVKNSLVKTLQSIIARRLRFLSLDEGMISDDIVHVYKYMHPEKDDSELIIKLLKQLSDPKIVIEDSDVVEKVEPLDADNTIWAVIDQVLVDLKMDYFSDNDDAETVVIGKMDTEEDSIKTEEMDTYVIQNIRELIKEKESLTTQGCKSVKQNKKRGPRKENITTDIAQREIPLHPKFVITVKSVIKKMKPLIYDLRGDMNVLRVLDITTYEIRRRIRDLVAGKPYMKSADITNLYRQRYPMEKDFKFVWRIIDNFKRGAYSDFSTEDNKQCHMGNELKESTERLTETDDVIIVENQDIILVVDDEGDVKPAVKQEIPDIIPFSEIEKGNDVN